MKKMRKIASVILAVMMLAVMAFPVGAAELPKDTKKTITIKKANANHTYTAYQVFAGTLSEQEGKHVLSNIEWGQGIDSAALLTALASDTVAWGTDPNFTSSMSAADVAKILESNIFENDNENTKIFAKIAADNIAANKGIVLNSSNNFSADVAIGYYVVVDTINNDTQNEVVSEYMLGVVGDVTVETKSEYPTVEKTVSKEHIGTNNSGEAAVSAKLGDLLHFEIKATLPDNFATYDKGYKLVFNDTYSDGLTYQEDSTHLYLVNGSTWTEINLENNANVSFETGTNTLTWTIFDVNQVPGVLSTSEFLITYEAKLNENAIMGNGTDTITGNHNDVYLTYSNNPYTTGTGTSTSSVARIYSYQINVTKTDASSGAALAGAEFTLYKAKVDTSGNLLLTDDGDIQWIQIETLTGTGTDGNLFDFTHLNKGYYKLVESKVPSGYNKMKDLEFRVVPIIENGDLTGLQILNIDNNLAADGFTTSIVDGSIKITVENEKGSTLPSTGGIGTTIFYVIGGVLVVGALIALVTKRRLDTEE